MLNDKSVRVMLGDFDALLLQGSLRDYRDRFEAAGNTTMIGMLDRVETALATALAATRQEPQKVRGILELEDD